MDALIYIAAAVIAYLIGGINPAIIISQEVYQSDVRSFGSHNPGFTNFKRIFGNHHAWTVFLVDVFKSALMCAIFGWLFEKYMGMFQLGAAYTSMFTLLGHAYPIWHGFRGGKGVSVMFAAFWFIDWRGAVAAVVVFLIVMLATRYMSLSVMCAGVGMAAALFVLGVSHPAVLVIVVLCVIFVIARHRENIKRLAAGTESKFSLKSKPSNENAEQ